ncbi:MAG: c-type cytochrome [Pirellulales bacterium]|nr:c-type cytochrome [Pirellulales bacterium]
MVRFVLLALLLWMPAGYAVASEPGAGERLAYLEGVDPYYPGRDFARLVTPQWIGEPGVEAVAVLAIDDMRGHEKWEHYLRPILERLKQIDGRAPVSIMTNQIDPADQHLQKWLAEGVGLDTHTFDHPCPLLAEGSLEKARATYEKCVDLLARVPGNRPVAFRMPCCDSLNTVSPRFYEEIFKQQTPGGLFLSVDSSVFNILTSNDPELPRELVIEPDGAERFRRYVPFESFVNTIEDYPFPYPIAGRCWEFPCVVPSDWSAQHVQQPNNPRTVRDLSAALDAVVVKRGVYNLVFHPHGWIRHDQIVELIEHAVQKHGHKVKFLNFREALDRLTTHALAGQPLRAADGGDNGVRLIDLNDDGYLDVVIGNDTLRRTRLWSHETGNWRDLDFPTPLVTVDAEGRRHAAGARFGIVGPAGEVVLLVRNEKLSGAWRFHNGQWREDPALLQGLELAGEPILTMSGDLDRGVRLRDVDADGSCELFVSNGMQNAVFTWNDEQHAWQPARYRLPDGIALVDRQGHDRGLRLVDLDDNGQLDLVYSNETEYAVHLFESADQGWGAPLQRGTRPDDQAVPPIVRGTTNNGAWFHSRHLWVQNEDTARLKDLVDRRSYHDLLAGSKPREHSPAQSLTALRVRDGFVVELVAAEPLVTDPVAIDWDPQGRLLVAEMNDYPRHGTRHTGCVRVLEDTDGDGRFDRSTVFLDDLQYPNSVKWWGRGLLVTSAPDILYAEDTDGDGKADIRQPLFTGFGEGNPQHVVNGLQWGLDNWLYCANGDSGGAVTSPQNQVAVDINGRDFRIRPDDGSIDPQAGFTQFIRIRDDWGNWFGNNNINPLWHYRLADHYLRRNPHVAPPSGRRDVSENPGSAPVFPRSRTLERFNDLHTANRFTSACGPAIYRDELLGPGFEGNSFVCEPVHNLVHREIVRPEGLSFSSRRPDDERRSEFLASTDNWFRPVMVRTGPDGALWVVDMYRAVIEHPEWIPSSMLANLDVRAGATSGRIYRIYPVGKQPRDMPHLGAADTAGLVAMLESPNGWVRDSAQQMLLERKDTASAAEPLKRLVREGKRPTARLHALCTLEGLGVLDGETVRRALADPHPGVRRHAIRVSESLLEYEADLGVAVATLVEDNDPQVALQLAYTLGAWNDPRAGRPLARLAVRHADDEIVQAAVLSSVAPQLAAVVRGLIEELSSAEPPAEIFGKLLATATAAGDEDAVVAMLPAITARRDDRYANWQMAALAELLDLLDRQDRTLADFREQAPAELQGQIDRLAGLFVHAREVALAADDATADRLAALRLLGRNAPFAAEDVDALRQLLAPRQPQALREAAVEAIGRLRDARVPELLLADWKGCGPELRDDILDVLFRREEWQLALLAAIDEELILPSELDTLRRQRLVEHKSPEVRDRAARLFSGDTNSDRRRVVEEHRSVLSLPGDAARGDVVFAKRCAVCHRWQEKGHAIGPDLSALTDKSGEALLVALLDPNRAVEAKFTSYTAVTQAGLTYNGILTNETGTSLTLLAQEGKEQVVLRNEIEALESSGKSLMPEGLERDLSEQDLADVIAFLQGVSAQPKQMEGNSPALVTPDPLRREFSCLSSNCEIYGDTLRIEEVNGALGYWNSENDHAVWEIDVPREGLYDVLFDWSCDDSCAGNYYVMEVSGARLTGRVEGTGDWNAYRREKVGEVRLPAGKQRLGIRASGRIQEALFDLRSVTLRPRGR